VSTRNLACGKGSVTAPPDVSRGWFLRSANEAVKERCPHQKDVHALESSFNQAAMMGASVPVGSGEHSLLVPADL
jgi:hypothetical protein